MPGKEEYIKLIKAECAAVNLDSVLFCAIVNTESSWNPDAMRYEKNFDYIWRPAQFAATLGISADTEITLQRFSYGLCQIMGANLRSFNIQDPLFKALDPAINIKYGVNFFKKQCDLHKDIKDKIASYNSGSPIKLPNGNYANQQYVDTVLKAMDLFK